MEDTDNISKVMEALDKVRKKHNGQYLENIVETCSSEYGLDQIATMAAIEKAKEKGLLLEVHVNQKISYRRPNTKKVIIEDFVDLSMDKNEPTDSGRKYVELDDYHDFKSLVHAEVQSMKARIDDTAADQLSGMDPLVRILIHSFKDRIASLEKQLDEKQKLIEKLMERPIFETVQKQNRNVDVNSPMTTGATPGAGTVVQNNGPSNEKKEQKNPKPQGKEVDSMTEQNSNRTPKEQDDPTKTATKKPTRKKVVIIGDSLLNGLEENKMRRRHDIQIRPHPGASSLDISDHIKPIMRRNPDCVIVHTGTNDITKHEDTINNIEKLVNEAKRISPSTNLVLSELIIRHDTLQRKQKSEDLNKKLKDLAKRLQIPVICHANIDSQCLGKGKLHLNRKGNSFLARNLLDFSDTYFTTEEN